MAQASHIPTRPFPRCPATAPLVFAALLALLLAVGAAPRAARAESDPAILELRRTPVVRAVQKAEPAVVNITSTRTVERTPFAPAMNNPFLRRFFEELYGEQVPTQKFTAESLGSGVIIDGAKGLVLTNAHVIEGATQISVRLLDGRELKADMVGSDPDFDLAVLKVEDSGPLPALPMADSSDILIGETVIAIGNPYGYTNTVTTGVVSALNRSITTKQGTLTDFIQTDAAINPGNSGGPLLNIAGQLIGINTAIHAKAEGIGFAIPINKARRVVAELLETGHVTPSWLGVFGQDVDQQVASYFGLDRVAGLLITDTYPDSPARRADLRPGDVILAVNGQTIEDKSHFLSLLRNHTRGETVHLLVVHSGERRDVALRLQAMDEATAEKLVRTRWGIAATASDSGGARVQTIVPGSPAAHLGLQPGDVIHQIGNRRIRGRADLLGAFLRYRLHANLLLRVQRGNTLYYVRMNL